MLAEGAVELSLIVADRRNIVADFIHVASDGGKFRGHLDLEIIDSAVETAHVVAIEKDAHKYG